MRWSILVTEKRPYGTRGKKMSNGILETWNNTQVSKLAISRMCLMILLSNLRSWVVDLELLALLKCSI